LFFEAGLGDSLVDVSVEGEAAIEAMLEIGILEGSWGEDENGSEVVLFKPYHPNLWEEIVFRLHLADAEMRLAACPTNQKQGPSQQNRAVVVGNC
jgi:hypothetical protein